MTLNAYQSASAVRLLNEHAVHTVAAYLPTRQPCPACGGSEYLGGGLNAACPVCDQTGYVTTWRVSHIAARVAWETVPTLRWSPDGTVADIEVADLVLQVPMHCIGVVEAVRDTPAAYMVVDGRKVNVLGVVYNRLDSPTTVTVRCYVQQD